MAKREVYSFVDGEPCEVIASGSLLCMFGQNGRIVIDEAIYDLTFIDNDSGKSTVNMKSEGNSATITMENVGRGLQSSLRMTVGALDGFQIYLDAFISVVRGDRGASRLIQYSFVKSKEPANV